MEKRSDSLTTILRRSGPGLPPVSNIDKPRDLDGLREHKMLTRLVETVHGDTAQQMHEDAIIEDTPLPPIATETRLQIIARLTRDLTYGEMMQYQKEAGIDPVQIHAWAMGVAP